MICIEQIDIRTQEVINVFESVKSAAAALNISCASISRVLHGSLKSSVKKRYSWKKVVVEKIIVEEKQKTRNFPIEQIDIQTGETLAIFESILDACKKMNYHYDGISSVIRCRSKSFKGYFWRRLGSNNKYIRNKSSTARIIVEQIDKLTGKTINTFTSITAASSSVKCSTCSISMCVHGKNKSAKGYIWRKKDISSKV